jgi:hypothetical protein
VGVKDARPFCKISLEGKIVCAISESVQPEARDATVTSGRFWQCTGSKWFVDAAHSHKDVGILLQLRELPKGGWFVSVTLRRPDSEIGTKYKVKTIFSTRTEAEVSGLALARGMIGKEHQARAEAPS